MSLKKAKNKTKAPAVVHDVESFIKKFGCSMDTNDCCLEDMACPKCGSRGDFNIEVITSAQFGDTGCEDHGDMEWSNDSFISCMECDHGATIRRFTFEGLDCRLDELRMELECEGSDEEEELDIEDARNNTR